MSWASSGQTNDVIYVPVGYTTTYTGYLFTEQSGRETLVALRTYRQERDIWEQGYNDLFNEHTSYREKAEKELLSLEQVVQQERSAWERELKKKSNLGLGVFAGVAYTSSGKIQPAIGVGIVWKIK